MSGESGFERRSVKTAGGGRLMTKQAEKDSADVNKLVDRWRKTGVLPHASNRQPHYGDFTGRDDFHGMMTRVREAERQFFDLPSRIRDYCGNDAAEYLDLCLNPERREECEKLGIKEAQLPDKAILVRLEEKSDEEAKTPPASS